MFANVFVLRSPRTTYWSELTGRSPVARSCLADAVEVHLYRYHLLLLFSVLQLLFSSLLSLLVLLLDAYNHVST